MYTAILQDRLIENGKIRWVVNFTNGTDSFVDSFYASKYSDVQPIVARKLSELNYEDDHVINGVIDSTIPTTPELTNSEKERDAWLKDWQMLQQANKLVSTGIIEETDNFYVTLKAKVVSGFKEEYINNI